MSTLDEHKAKFINWLIHKDLYITLAMLAKCSVVVREDCPSLAAISIKSPPVLTLHPWLLDNASDMEMNAIFMHELSHLPQMVYVKTIWASVEYPDTLDTEVKQKAATQSVINRATDIALHEQLKRLMPDIENLINGAIQRFVSNPNVSGAFATAKMSPGMDAAYYVGKLLEDNNIEFVDLDGHEFGEGDEDMEGFMRDAEAEGRILANKAGKRVGDADLHLGVDPLIKRVKDAILKIRVSVNRIAAGKATNRYDWNRLNPYWSGLPGKMKSIEKTAGIFIVADTSGSMCQPATLNQLVPAVEFLKTRNLVAGAYACDVALTPFSRKVKGGGGTELEPHHADELRALHKLPKGCKIDIVYLTDGYVNLDNLERDPTVALHVVKI